jgi:mannitol-specific phosphotransferase system IIBC component
VLLGVLIATAVSFVSAAFILKVTGEKATDIEEAKEQSRAHKNVQARPQEA